MTSSTLALAIAVSVLAGCAAGNDPNAAPTPPTERVYRTGSNIPVRDPQPASAEDKQKAEAARAAPRDAKP